MSDVLLCSQNFQVCAMHFKFSYHVSLCLLGDDIDAICCFVCAVMLMHTYSLATCGVLFTCIAQARLLRSPVSLSRLDPFLIE